MLRFAFCLALSLALSAPGAGASEEASEMRLSIEDGRLTLEAERVPLRRVLEAVAAHAGFTIELRGQFPDEVSPSIYDLPLHTAIGELLGAGDHSFFLRFAAREPGRANAELAHLVVIAGNAEGAQAWSVPAGEAQAPDPPADQPDRSSAPEDAAMGEALEILQKMLQEEEDELLREAAAEALSDLEEIAVAD